MPAGTNTTADGLPQEPAPAERVQRALARAGLGSRRACEELIRAGRVSVNGVVATIGDKVAPLTDVVEVDGAIVPLDPALRTYAFHKPVGVVTTMSDPQGRTDLTGFLPEGERVFPVGRLDRDTEGLLLLTNDGELANRLTHPRYGVEKEYLAEVGAEPGPRHIARIKAGVELDDGPAKAVSVSIAGVHRGRGQLRLVMTEGRKREVRRLLDAVGLPVARLVRVRVGPVRLGDLEAGSVRELPSEDVRALYAAAGR